MPRIANKPFDCIDRFNLPSNRLLVFQPPFHVGTLIAKGLSVWADTVVEPSDMKASGRSCAATIDNAVVAAQRTMVGDVVLEEVIGQVFIGHRFPRLSAQ